MTTQPTIEPGYIIIDTPESKEKHGPRQKHDEFWLRQRALWCYACDFGCCLGKPFHANLIYRRKLPVEDLTPSRAEFEALKVDNFNLKALVLLWSSTFQKYQSCKANGLPSKEWPDNVIADYERMRKITDKIL